MQTLLQKNETPNSRLSLWTLAAALIALGALGLTLGDWVLPILLSLGLIASAFTETRFESASRPVWVVRIALYVWVLFWSWSRLNAENGDSLDNMLAYGAGLGAGSELMLQAWLNRPFGGARGAVTVLLSGAIMMGASVTFDPAFIRFLMPVYMLCLAFSLRTFGGNSRRGSRLNNRRRGLANLAILLAITAGAATHITVAAYRYQISQLGAKLFNENIHAEPVGLSTDPHLGATFGDSNSTTRVLRLENWPKDEQYLRVMSFTTYHQGSWGPPLDSRKFSEITLNDLGGGTRGRHARIERLIDDQGLVVVPLHTETLIPPGGASLECAPEGAGPLRSKDPAPYPFVYDLVLPPFENGPGPFCTPPSPAEKERCLQIPDEIPMEVRLLAQGIAGGESDPMQRVRAVENYLMAHNQYSSHTRPGAGDPTTNFILEKKAAHCEYFASAAAMLLRCVDVPTRYVIGYYVSEDDGNGNAVVRFRDGHAWCESWIEGIGWVTVDATPASARPDQTNPPIPFWEKLRERMQDAIMLVRNSLGRLAQLPRSLLIGLALLVMVGLALRRLLLACKARVPGFQYASSADLHPVSRRFEKLLRRRGIPCPEERTWREHVDALAADSSTALQIDIPAALNFIRLYNRARFARGAPRDILRLHEVLSYLEKTAKPGK